MPRRDRHPMSHPEQIGSNPGLYLGLMHLDVLARAVCARSSGMLWNLRAE
jgi:hypothetical protein